MRAYVASDGVREKRRRVSKQRGAKSWREDMPSSGQSGNALENHLLEKSLR